MYAEKKLHIHYYSGAEKGLYVTEFGHSCPDTDRRVGPYVRDVWLLHVVVRDTCHFCGFDAQAGEAFLIAKGQLHSFAVHPGYEHYWMAFAGADAAQLGALFHLDMAAHRKLSLKINPGELEDMLRSAFEQADGPGGERKATALILSLLAYHAPEEQNQSGYVPSACAFMRHNYHRRITMEETARAVNLSEKHLCRLFKREIQTTPMRYLISLRMNRARELLENTLLPVKDIAAAVGYPSPLAFSTAFSAYWGISPTAMRADCR